MRMNYTLLILLFCLICTVAWPESKAEDPNQALIKAFLEYEKVKPTYEKCLKSDDKNKTIADCVWNGIDKETRRELTNAISSKENQKNKDDDNRKPASNSSDKNSKTDLSGTGKDYEGVYLGSFKPFKKDEALNDVSDYLFKRFEKSIYGTNRDVTKVIAHNKFHTLYQSQLGKNIIHAYASYCVEAELFKNADKMIADPTTAAKYGNFLIPKKEEERLKRRKENIKLLTQFNDQGENKAYHAWVQCLIAVKNICYRKIGLDRRPKDANGLRQGEDNRIDYGKKIKKEGKDEKDWEYLVPVKSYAHNRACQVTHYVREHRQNIIATKEIITKMEEQTKLEANINFEEADIKFYKGGKGEGEEDLNEMTTISSREFYDAYKENGNKRATEFKEKCLEQQDEEVCKKYLITGKEKEEMKKKWAEYELRRKTMEEKIKNIDTADDAKKYLKEEGYTDKQIQSMFADTSDENKIRDAIATYYSKEKISLMDTIEKQLAARSTKGDDLQFEADGNDEGDMDTLKAIEKELKTNGKRYQEMLHFSNIISGFLTIKTEGKEDDANTTSLFRELKYEEKSEGDRLPAGDSDERGSHNLVDIKKLREKVNEVGLTETDTSGDDEESSEAGTRNLEVETINDFMLNYDIEKKKTDK